LATAEDAELFEKARTAGAVVFTKDHDFVQLQERRGAPPKILWLTCGRRSYVKHVKHRPMTRMSVRDVRQKWPEAQRKLAAAGEIVITRG